MVIWQFEVLYLPFRLNMQDLSLLLACSNNVCCLCRMSNIAVDVNAGVVAAPAAAFNHAHVDHVVAALAAQHGIAALPITQYDHANGNYPGKWRANSTDVAKSSQLITLRNNHRTYVEFVSGLKGLLPVFGLGTQFYKSADMRSALHHLESLQSSDTFDVEVRFLTGIESPVRFTLPFSDAYNMIANDSDGKLYAEVATSKMGLAVQRLRDDMFYRAHSLHSDWEAGNPHRETLYVYSKGFSHNFCMESICPMHQKWVVVGGVVEVVVWPHGLREFSKQIAGNWPIPKSANVFSEWDRLRDFVQENEGNYHYMSEGEQSVTICLLCLACY